MANTKKGLSYQPAPIPQNEKERLEALFSLNILDTQPEERFDRITRLALELFNVPISTITLVDEDREWFKSCQGLPNKEGKRAISFCGHAMLAPDIFIIPDTKKDERFAKNPMVVEKPYIRFYAGVAIKSANGQRIGTFCIKDRKPRRLDQKQKDLLKFLSSWAELEVNAYKLSEALEARREAEEKVVELNEILRLLNKILRHDILNNITIIKVNLELFLKGKREDMRLETAATASKKSENLIKKMKELETAVSTGASLVPFNIGRILKEITNNNKETQIKMNGNGKVLADNALISVFENLIGNAKIHGNANKVTVSVENDKEHVLIKVADNGIGIPDKIRKNLFTEGYKYGHTGHTGLGLYIVKKTIERYGGKIEVENNKPRGAVFKIKLQKA